MSVINLKMTDSNIFEILLSECLDESKKLCFCERIDAPIWDFHFRRLEFSKEENSVYSFDCKKLLPCFESDRDKVMDLFLIDSLTQKSEPIVLDLEKSFVDSFSMKVEMDYGKLGCQYYKNGNGGLSVKVKFAPYYAVDVVSMEDSPEFVRLLIKTQYHSDKIQYFLARKSSKNYSLKYDFEIPIEHNNQQGVTELKLTKTNLFLGFSKGGEEVWELIAKVGGIYLTVVCSNGYNDVVFDESDSVKAKIKFNELVRVYTYENDNKHQHKLKVAVLGSCFSRQAFNSKSFFNPDYKRFYECGITAYHMSIPSIMSNKIPHEQNDLVGEYQSDINVYGKVHFDKSFLSQLAEYRPDYMIMENYVHITAALIEVAGGGFIDENYYLVGTPAFKKLKVTKRIPAESEEHFEIYKENLLKFKKAISSFIPEDRIVIVRSQPALMKREGDVISEWDSKQAILYRRYIWERYDSFFVSVFPKAKIIDMRDDKYISEKSEHLKFAPSHFGTTYYKDLLNSFNKIVLQDLISKMGEKL